MVVDTKGTVAVSPIVPHVAVVAIHNEIADAVAIEVARGHPVAPPATAPDRQQCHWSLERRITPALEKLGNERIRRARCHDVEDAVTIKVVDDDTPRWPAREIRDLPLRAERAVGQLVENVDPATVIAEGNHAVPREIDERFPRGGVAHRIHRFDPDVRPGRQVQAGDHAGVDMSQHVGRQGTIDVHPVLRHAHVVAGRRPAYGKITVIEVEGALDPVRPRRGVGVGRHVEEERPVVAHRVGQAPRVVKTEVERLSLSRRDGKHGHQVRQVRAPLNDVNPPGTSSPHREGCPLRRRPVGHANRDLAVLPRNRDAHLRTLGPIWLHCQ